MVYLDDSRHEEEASMKAPPKRKGNPKNKVMHLIYFHAASMKAPPKRKGNLTRSLTRWARKTASMKAPPKRKGNLSNGCTGRRAGRGPQ